MTRRELRIKRPTEENSVATKRFTQVHSKRSFVLAEETILHINFEILVIFTDLPQTLLGGEQEPPGYTKL